MPKTPPSVGSEFAQRFDDARRELPLCLVPGARELPTIVGLNLNGSAVVPIENLLANATIILLERGGIYLYGDNVVLERGTAEKQRLFPLTSGVELVPAAAPMMANVFQCVSTTDKNPCYFPPPRGFLANLLARDPSREALPKITCYGSRPLFDQDFVLCGPGYHADSRILVHGSAVDARSYEPAGATLPIEERLSPHIRTLLREFCFSEAADIANALATLLTGALANHFVEQPKPVILVDGNQPGTGKTLLASCVSMLLDDESPDLINFSNDDAELGKRTLATLLQRVRSVLVFDNAKCSNNYEISSSFLEANSMAASITLRKLGKSQNYSQPNDLLWFLTMNQTHVSADLASRGLPIRLYFEGDPGSREFANTNPLAYTKQHRMAILGELVGMVDYWNSRGRPFGQRSHRCAHWAQVVGGIMETCGFPEFLGNLDGAAASFNTTLTDLAALAEQVIRVGAVEAFSTASNN